jgi:hypothetical protein
MTIGRYVYGRELKGESMISLGGKEAGFDEPELTILLKEICFPFDFNIPVFIIAPRIPAPGRVECLR